MPSSLTLAQLRVFDAVAKNSSFSRAAEKLSVTQPYISGQIAGLEARLGVTLFNRVGRRAYLSEAGKLLTPYAENVLNTLNEAQQSLQDYSGLVTGHLVIAASSTPGTYLAPRLLGQFLADYPGVQITLQILDRMQVEQTILKQEAEIGIVASHPDSSELSVEPLGLDEMVLVVGSNHPWVNRASIDIHELRQERLISRERTSGTRIRVDQEFSRVGVEPRSSLELTNTEAIKEAVAAGLGVAFLSERAVRHEITSQRLIAVRLMGQKLTRPICLLMLQGRKLSTAANILRNLILADFISPQHR
jgi:DNA-binding transcriptional LysR family regulator